AKMVEVSSNDIEETNKEFTVILDSADAVGVALSEQKNIADDIKKKSTNVTSSIESLSAFSQELLSTVETTTHETQITADETKRIIESINEMRSAAKEMADSLDV
nr:hypothetical protein [Lachnospiraceae bacterium]